MVKYRHQESGSLKICQRALQKNMSNLNSFVRKKRKTRKGLSGSYTSGHFIWNLWNKPSASVRFCLSYLISSQSLYLAGRRGTTDDVATIPFHPSLSSAALRESPNPIPVHSLMLSSHLFCLPLLLAPFTVPCGIVFAMPEDLEMWPYHLSFRFFTMVRRSSCTPITF